MAHHKSAKKRIRQTKKRNLYNRYYAKTVRNAVRNFRTLTDKVLAVQQLPSINSLLDKLAKKGIIHKNKAANLASKLTKKVNAM